MTTTSLRPGRRAVLKTAAGLAVSPVFVGVPAQAAQAPIPARAGEFDFLNGEWRIANRRLKGPGD